MNNFFESIGAIFDFFISQFEMLGRLFKIMGSSFSYISALIAFLPDYLISVVCVFAVVSLVYMILNWS